MTTAEPLPPPTALWRRWTVLVVLGFAAVYAASLTFVYVEGDDASSIAYHALGRQPSIQPPYSPYQGLMDRILGVLPAHEPTLRITAIALSSLAALLFVLLTLDFVFARLPEAGRDGKGWLAAFLLAACPELFYLGLFYDPNVVAMVLLLAAHRLIRRAPRTQGLPDLASGRGRLLLALSLAAFGFGTACRWDMATYGAVIVADLALGLGPPSTDVPQATLRRRLIFALTWGAGAGVAVLGALWISGYGVVTLAQKVIWGVGMATGESKFSRQLDLRTVLGLLPMLSPAFVLASGFGLGVLARRRDPRALFVLLGGLLMAPWINLGIPKYLLAGFPGLALGMAAGLTALWRGFADRGPRLGAAVRALLILLVAGPWGVGLRAFDPDRSWGPGFEIRPFDEEPAATEHSWPAWPVLGAGLALPTSEGPRPTGGHAPVLAGGWRTLVSQLDDERRTAIDTALRLGLPLLQDQGEGYATSHLVRLGFRTQDPTEHLRIESSDRVIERRFEHPSGDRLLVLRCRNRSSLTEGGDDFDELSAAAGRRVVIYGYGSTLRGLHRLAPAALDGFGTTSAILDLELLRRAHPRQRPEREEAP